MLKQFRDRIVASLCSILDNLLVDDPNDPDNVDTHVRLAKIKYRTGDLKGAVEDLDVALKHDPRNADAFYWRSRAKYDAGNAVQALHDMLKATQLRPEDSQPLYMLGNIHLQLENYADAELAYSQAIQHGNCQPAAYAGRGYARYGMQKLDIALDDLLAAKDVGFDGTPIDEYIDKLRSKLNKSETEN